MRQCTLCLEDIPTKTTGSVIAIKSFKFYQNYNRDITRMSGPTQRKAHVWCPKCTKSFNDWLTAHLEDVRVGTEEGYQR